jgi:flavodoxin I
MNKIGLFFGTETGTTRLIAKKMQKSSATRSATSPQRQSHHAGRDAAVRRADPRHAELRRRRNPRQRRFRLLRAELGGISRPVAGQAGLQRQAHRLLRPRGAGTLRRPLLQLAVRAGREIRGWGAEIVGDWPIDGYTFEHSAAEVDGRFIGLIIDQRTQGMFTDERIDTWLAQVVPLLQES